MLMLYTEACKSVWTINTRVLRRLFDVPLLVKSTEKVLFCPPTPCVYDLLVFAISQSFFLHTFVYAFPTTVAKLVGSLLVSSKNPEPARRLKKDMLLVIWLVSSSHYHVPLYKHPVLVLSQCFYMRKVANNRRHRHLFSSQYISHYCQLLLGFPSVFCCSFTAS